VLDVVSGRPHHIAFFTALKDSGATERLMSMNETIVLFAPDDAAVSTLVEGTVSRLLKPEWNAHLVDLILHHMIVIDEGDAGILENLLSLPLMQESFSITTEQGSVIRIDAADVNDAIVATNGAVYFTKRVFLPESMTDSVQSKLSSEPKFATLYELIGLAGIEEPLKDAAGPMTVLAPSDAAFDKMDPALLTSLKHPNQKADLLELLAYQFVYDENLLSAQYISKGGGLISTLNGGNITVSAVNGTIILGNETEITEADILVNNGVIHGTIRETFFLHSSYPVSTTSLIFLIFKVIDSVIFPPDFDIEPRTRSSLTTTSMRDNSLKRLAVVALGDSFISGNGARASDGSRDYDDLTCYRSEHSWAAQYGKCLENPQDEREAVNVHFTNRAW
jgi:uncharacterized surface protein with fasciclin (FAS1) repeats